MDSPVSPPLQLQSAYTALSIINLLPHHNNTTEKGVSLITTPLPSILIVLFAKYLLITAPLSACYHLTCVSLIMWPILFNVIIRLRQTPSLEMGVVSIV